jgi:hypothetical protein
MTKSPSAILLIVLAGLQHPAERGQPVRMEVRRERIRERGSPTKWRTCVTGYPKHVSVPDIRCELNIQHGPLVIGGQGREVAAVRQTARRIEPRRVCQGRYLPRREDEGEDGVLLRSPA